MGGGRRWAREIALGVAVVGGAVKAGRTPPGLGALTAGQGRQGEWADKPVVRACWFASAGLVAAADRHSVLRARCLRRKGPRGPNTESVASESRSVQSARRRSAIPSSRLSTARYTAPWPEGGPEQRRRVTAEWGARVVGLAHLQVHAATTDPKRPVLREGGNTEAAASWELCCSSARSLWRRAVRFVSGMRSAGLIVSAV
jgi:hypothetical protein